MNPLQRWAPADSFASVDARRTITEVTDAYFDGGHWQALLNEVVAPQDHQAAEALEGLLDLAREHQLTNLQLAAEGHLRNFSCKSSAWLSAKLVLAPTTDDVLFAFDKDNAGEAKPMWERAIERWAAVGDRDALERLSMLLASPRPRLSAAVRRVLLKMQDTVDASMHADINRLLGTAVPYREAGRHTKADGDCLVHALRGTVSPDHNIYQCDAQVVHEVRKQLSVALARHHPTALPEPIAQVVQGFYAELLEVSLCAEDSDLPNRRALEQLAQQLGVNKRGQVRFDQLNAQAQTTLVREFARFMGAPGHYLPCALVPLLAQVSGRAVSLYAEPHGWQHFGADGKPCGPTQDAVAIRFHARLQHYERVVGPQESAVQLVDDVNEEAVPNEPQAQQVPHFPVVRRPPPRAISTAALSTRTGSASSLFELSVSAKASKPLNPRKDGLVTRFFNWAGRLFR